MPGPTLSLTRDQFASFLSDFEQIKQFERLFANTNANSISIDDVSIAAGNAGGSANDALAQIIELSETLNKEPSPVNVSQLAVIETQLQALGIVPPASNGSVTSVAASGGSTGLTFSGSPITTSGTLTLGGTLALASGGTGATTAAIAITNLGATTLGGNMFTLTNPSAVTFPRFNADNTVSALDAATFRTAIGAGTGGGSVTSVSGTGTVNGITLTGTVTSSGSLTLGGTLSGVSLTTQVSGTLPIANGGTNGTSTPTAGAVPYGTGTAYAFTAAGTSGQVLTSAGAGVPTWTTPTTGTVTSVTGTAPVVSSGGTTPAISMAAATTSVNGYLTSTDWTTFNGKQAALVSGTNIKTVGGVSLLGAGDVGTITAAYGGTGQSSYAVGDILYASATTTLSKLADVATGNAIISGGVGVAPSYGKIGLTTHISGTLAVGNGGTGATTLTSGYLTKGNGTSAISASVAYDDGTSIGIGTTAPNTKLQVTVSPAPGADNGMRVTDGTRIIQTNVTGSSYSYIGIGASETMLYSSGNPLNIVSDGQPIKFIAGTAERMRIDTSGNVGIGTASPASKLDIGSGNLRFSSTGQYIQGDFSGALGNRTAIQTSTASSNTVIPIVPSAAGFNAGILCETDPTFTSGSVGQFLVTAGVDVRVNSTLRGAGSYLPLTFHAGGAERVRVDTSGNVGVGATANASAILDVQSTTKGFRLPNMTTVQKNAISSPAAGLMVFDTTLAKACVYSGAAWQTITSI